jgi:hypothetical protein
VVIKQLWAWVLIMMGSLAMLVAVSQFLFAGSLRGIPSSYDVIVVGTDPEGIAAAVSGARNGLNTLLIDKRGKLGGLMTVGGLNSIDMNYNPRKELITKGIFYEFYQQIEGDSFDTNTAEKVFLKMVSEEKKIHTVLNATEITPVLKGNKVTGIKAIINGKKVRFQAGSVIDATQDADIAFQAGVPFTLGQEDIGCPNNQMAVTLVFKLGGLDWSRIAVYLQQDGDVQTGCNQVSAWGYWPEMLKYQSKDPFIKMRGLNLGRQRDGTVLVNGMHIFQVNPLSQDSKIKAITRAKQELSYLIPYLKQLPGFEKAFLVDVAEELYVRESRHMCGLYRLTLDDVLEHKDFWDKIACGSYPVDIQATAPDIPTLIVGKPAQYSIPFRCLVPQKIDNLLVVGRSASYDTLAHGSARVIPVGMVEGEAAGVAVAYSLAKHKSFRDISQNREKIQAIQQKLIDQGAWLEKFTYDYPLQQFPYYEAIKTIRKWGIIGAGYQNNYKLMEAMSESEWEELVNNINQRMQLVSKSNILTKDGLLTKDDLAYMLLSGLGLEVPYSKCYQEAVKTGLIPPELDQELKQTPQITRVLAYRLLANYVQKTPAVLGNEYKE